MWIQNHSIQHKNDRGTTLNTLNLGRAFRMGALAAWIASLGVLTACGSAPMQASSKSDLGRLAMRDYLTRAELAGVRVGMSEDEVKGLIGPAMLHDSADKSQWVYVVKQGQGPSEEFLRWAVFFKRGKVDRIAALESLDTLEQPPAVAEAAAKTALVSPERPPVLITGPSSLGSYSSGGGAPVKPMPAEPSSVALAPMPTPSPMEEAPAPIPEPASVMQQQAQAPTAPVEPPVSDQPVDSLDSAGEVSDMLTQWAAAWAAKDVKKYLSFYANTFEPGKLSRKEWESQRKARLGDRATIRVKLSDMEVNVLSNNRATVRFKQEYSSDKYRDVGNKMITLIKMSGAWKIQTEEFAK